jgi:DNA helicase-2/ATP-dependent DNA helicase PcrA
MTTPSRSLPRWLQPRSRAERQRPASLIDVDLDPAQRGAVELPAERALLVLGEAGHGKTTVALHRLAHVWRGLADRDGEAPVRAAVIVPSEGLARLLQPLVRRLGVDVEAITYDRWAAAQARRALRDVPRRESETALPLVARFKRDPAVRVALAELAPRAPARIDDDPDAPPARSRALVRRADLQQLFGDRSLVEAIARASGSVTSRMIDEVIDHTRVQFSRAAEDEWDHVTDRARLVAVDRRAMDDGTAAADAGSIDVEDYAILFELDRMRADRRGVPARAPRLYDVLVLDEAQEMAPLELALVGRSLAPGGTLVVAGDVHQQTDPTTAFLDWEATMRELGCAEYAAVELEIGYRCPPAIASIARRILAGGGSGFAAGGEPAAEFAPVAVAFDSERDLAARLGHDIAALQRRDPRASVAVICRSPLTARRMAEALRAKVPARLVFDGRFLARGPAQVTIVDEVKGLEFDFVLVPDATAVEYPDTPAARRALYVAATRARHQLLFAAASRPTPLLAGLTFLDPPRGGV